MAKSSKGMKEQLAEAAVSLGVFETPEGVLEEGVLFLMEEYEKEGLISGMEEARASAEKLDRDLATVVGIESKYGFRYAQPEGARREAMRQQLRATFKKESAELAGFYEELQDLEKHVRSKRTYHGVEIYAAPPTLDVVQRLREKRELISKIEERALDHCFKLLEQDENDAGGAVGYFTDVFQPAWAEYRGEEE